MLTANALSLHREPASSDIWWVIGIAGILGALYGVFVTPFWSEAVEFGQVWAGMVDYTYSPWGPLVFSAPSLQITIPALLLRAGCDVWSLSLAVSGTFCGMTFAAVAAAGYVFIRHIGLSVAMSVLFLTCFFANPHGYPAGYPFGYFQFGQTGQYYAMLALALLACGKPRAAGVIGGTLVCVHAVWFLFFFLGSVPVVFFLRRPMFRRFVTFLSVAVVATLLFQHFSINSFPPQSSYTAPSIPSAFASVEEPPKVRQKYEGHNILFSESTTPVRSAVMFFLSTAIWGLFAASYLRAHASEVKKSGYVTDVRLLLAMVAIPTFFAIGYKIVEEIDPQFSLLAFFDPRLPQLLLRAIMNRWFNMASLLIPLIYMGILAVLIRDKKSWLALVILVATFWFFRESWYIIPPYEAMNPARQAITPPSHMWLYLFALLGFWLVMLEKRWLHWHRPRLQNAIFSAALIALFSHYAITSFQQARRDHFYLSADTLNEISDVVRADKGQLLLSSSIISTQRFNPQLRTGRVIIVPAMVDVYDGQTKKLIDVYCTTKQGKPFMKFYTDVRPCFENRSAHDWQVIARELKATGMMTPADWTLKLKPVITSGGFHYYRLPSSAL